MGFLKFIDHWWNLPFLVMLGLVAVFFLLQLVGLAGHHGDHDVAHDHDHDAGGDGHGASWLAIFGVGRVPFMVVWVTLFLFAGFTGLFVNRVVYLEHERGYPGWAFAVALLAAAVIGLAAVIVAARLAGKLVDTGGPGAASKHDLRGRLGVVASAHLTDAFGEVRVADGLGNEMIVHAHLDAGDPPLAHGARVVLVDYDAERDLFSATVSPADMQASGE